MRSLLVCGGLWFVLAAGSATACVKCQSDAATCNGCDMSSGGSGCTCCLCALSPRNIIDEPQLGFSTVQRGGRLLVDKVFAGSPAQTSMIQAGDELVLLDNEAPIASYAPADDCLSETPMQAMIATARLTLRRGNQTFALSLHRVNGRTLLDGLWHSSKHKLLQLTGATSIMPRQAFTHEYSPYTFGLEAGAPSGALIITDILNGSPAWAAGLQLGDRIITLDGANSSSATLHELLQRDEQHSLRLEIVRGSAVMEVTLRSVGLSVILRSTPTIENAVLTAARQ